MLNNELTKKAADKLEEAAVALRNCDLETKIKQKIEPVEKTIQEHPIPSVLVGVGAGILIGALACKYYLDNK
jgi:ElaB/YqjD/DUF883 family membrane-anchored ribosome-binding protein